jgi:UDPglucose 6-dehydrogenase
VSRISVVGTGYVGLTTGVCFAHQGHTVSCIDVDHDKVARLNAGEVPIYEPGLTEILQQSVAAGRLAFTTNFQDGLRGAEYVFIAVGTPMSADGDAADMHYVYEAAASIAHALSGPAVVVNKSTSPIGTGDSIRRVLEENNPSLSPWVVVSNPEFLREGAAISDCLNPARVVLGSHDPANCSSVAKLYENVGCPIICTDLHSAEMIKYASNAFLATRLSFINEVSRICDALDADVTVVSEGMGLDPRIGSHFLNAGLGYGGSCFPKDVAALADMAAGAGLHPQMLKAVIDINADQRRWAVDTLTRELGGVRGKSIALWGLAFKPETDDLRFAPALEIADRLVQAGATVRGYDPVANPDEFPGALFPSAAAAAAGAHAIVICTEWSEFRATDWHAVAVGMTGDLVFDGRNCVVPENVLNANLRYVGVGRRATTGQSTATVGRN